MRRRGRGEMRRRTFIGAIAGAAFIRPNAAAAQRSARPLIGFLHSASPEPYARHLAAFREALAAAGYPEGKNLAVEYRWAEGRYDRLPAMAADLVQREVAVIAAMTFPTALAAKAATATIPIVFDSGSDPVAEGLVESLARPGGNLTGVSLFLTALDAKRLELLHQLLPSAGTFGLLINPRNKNAETQVWEAQGAAQALSLKLNPVSAAADDEIDASYATLAKRQIAGLIVGADAFLNSRREKLVALADRHAIPAVYFDREFTAAGGLMSYGTNIIDTYRAVAVYVGKILDGAKPADLPVQQPTKFELVVNLKTATALGLTVPQSILARADEVIE